MPISRNVLDCIDGTTRYIITSKRKDPDGAGEITITQMINASC